MAKTHDNALTKFFNWCSQNLGGAPNAPYGQKTDLKKTEEVRQHMYKGLFYAPQFQEISISNADEAWETLSTTAQDKKTGNTLIHDAIITGQPQGLRFILQLARARDELNHSLTLANKSGYTATSMMAEIHNNMKQAMPDDLFQECENRYENAQTLEDEASLPKAYYDRKNIESLVQALNNAVEHNKMRQNFRASPAP